MSQLWSGSHIRRANSVSTPGSHRTLEPRGRASNRRSPPDSAWEEGEREAAEFLSQLPATDSDISLSVLEFSKSWFDTIYLGDRLFTHELNLLWECGSEKCPVQRCESQLWFCQCCLWQQARNLRHWCFGDTVRDHTCLGGRHVGKHLVVLKHINASCRKISLH